MMQPLAIFFLAAVAIGGVAWVFLYPMLSGERQVERRKETIATKASSTVPARLPRNQQRSRREQIEGTLKELEARQNAHKSVPLQVKIAQAGLTWSKKQFYLISVALGLGAFFLFLIINAGLWAALAMAFAAGFGMPLWLLRYLKKRRERKFLDAFPDAVDTIVRGIKAGLPLIDSMRMIAADAPEPLRTEFRTIIETQAIGGIPIGEACAKLYERIPVPEANFFGIVISIQSKSGGNLSEALGNLSRVLRDRKKMKAKVQAMSMEAKSSAAIIASLPIAVIGLVYITTPSYIELLWTHPMGRVMLAGSACWMLTGVLVMRKMINFDF
jgi:tight adherence protein B